jgi:hypothetical protein
MGLINVLVVIILPVLIDAVLMTLISVLRMTVGLRIKNLLSETRQDAYVQANVTDHNRGSPVISVCKHLITRCLEGLSLNFVWKLCQR